MKKELIKTKQLKKVYDERAMENAVLDNVNLEIYENDFTIIMGNSGSGKSTLLYCISGMDKATSGEVYFDNKNLVKMNEDQLAVLRRKKMSFIFQQMNLMPNLTLMENVLVPAYLLKQYSKKELNQIASNLFEDVGISELQNRLPSQVSGGQLQRAAIARALINKPDLIFADEPTGALNSKSSNAVLDILTTCNKQGQSILMVTHDLKAALRGNRIIYLSDGGIKGEKVLSNFKEEVDFENREHVVYEWLQEMGW